MSLHIMGGKESIRVFADHKNAKPPFIGHKHVEYGSREYHRLVESAQDAGAGVYFSVNATDGRGAKQENIVRTRTYYVDIDGLKDKTPALEALITARLKPSAIVETKNGVHAYWYARTQTPVNLAQYKKVQLGLIKAFNGDRSAKDIARVLRVPDTWHLKDPDDPFLVRIVHQLPEHETPYYDANDLLAVYPAPQQPPRRHVRVQRNPNRWDAFLEDLNSWTPIPGERNNVMLLSAGVAIAYGVPQDEFVYSMLPICETWNTGRNVHNELRRVANWAYQRGTPIHPAALKARGVPVRKDY